MTLSCTSKRIILERENSIGKCSPGVVGKLPIIELATCLGRTSKCEQSRSRSSQAGWDMDWINRGFMSGSQLAKSVSWESRMNPALEERRQDIASRGLQALTTVFENMSNRRNDDPLWLTEATRRRGAAGRRPPQPWGFGKWWCSFVPRGLHALLFFWHTVQHDGLNSRCRNSFQAVAPWQDARRRHRWSYFGEFLIAFLKAGRNQQFR